MKSKLRTLFAITFATLSVTFTANAQDHGHINAGAETQLPGSKLIFANGSDFATNTLYVKTLTFTNAARYAGYFLGNTTVTVLAATPDFAGPEPFAPALGSYIFAQLASLEGPEGGEFGFWEAGATEPTLTIKSGETGTNLWRITEADGSPGTDPYGHIHGRRWTLSKPGLYAVGFRLFDLSTNGDAGGPIHAPSEILYTYVQAGVNILSVQPDGDHTTIRFAVPLGTDWQLESSDTLTEPIAWSAVADPVTGNDMIREIIDPAPPTANRFYRVKSLVPQ
jgi:hypothetical protein